jgi:asparagine synthase (glutamine-hydrolysing)
MLSAMDYEAFYNHGCYRCRDLGLHVGWVNRVGAFSDCMPVQNEREDVALIFDGENFADGDIIRQLKSRGHRIDGENAGYLVHLYEEKGDEFFRSLNGWFSGLLIDHRAKKAVLFNDRFGMQKVYYCENKEAFYFASEAKALLAVRPELRGFDLTGLGQHLSVNCTLGSTTLFKGISRLPAGAAWTWRGPDQFQKRLYFSPKSWENQPILESERFYQEFKDTFLKVLPRYFNSDHIAMSLTAGLDTRLVMACLDRKPKQLPCFTFGGITRETLDILRARQVARLCQQPHQVIRLQQDFFANFSELADKTIFISDGCLDVCSSHDLYFNRIARQIAPIRMTGKFGSEVVRNRSMFKPVGLNKELFNEGLGRWIDEGVIALADLRSGHSLTTSVFKELPWNEHGKLAIEQSQLALRTPYMDNELVQLVYQAPDDVRSSDRTQLRLIEECSPTLRLILTNRGTAGPSNYFASKCLQLYYYGLLKADYIYLYAMPNWMTRVTSLLAPMGFEKLFLGRQKFEHYRLWLRDQLLNFVQEVLLDERTLQRPFFNRAFIGRIVQKHARGEANYFAEINKALTLELTSRQLLEAWPQREPDKFVSSPKVCLRNS